MTWLNSVQKVIDSVFCSCMNVLRTYNPLILEQVAQLSRCGEIGIHDGFKIRCLRAWRFKSAHRYQIKKVAILRPFFVFFDCLLLTFLSSNDKVGMPFEGEIPTE